MRRPDVKIWFTSYSPAPIDKHVTAYSANGVHSVEIKQGLRVDVENFDEFDKATTALGNALSFIVEEIAAKEEERKHTLWVD